MITEQESQAVDKLFDKVGQAMLKAFEEMGDKAKELSFFCQEEDEIKLEIMTASQGGEA